MFANPLYVTLINVNPLPPQLPLRDLNLLHQLLMRLRHILERDDAPSELEQQVRC